MRKRISCKVIRTIPLSQCGVELRNARSSNDKPHNISNAAAGNPLTKEYVWGPAANPQVRLTNNSVRNPKAHKSTLGTVTYTDRLDITRMSIDDGLTAQVLDLYV